MARFAFSMILVAMATPRFLQAADAAGNVAPAEEEKAVKALESVGVKLRMKDARVVGADFLGSRAGPPHVAELKALGELRQVKLGGIEIDDDVLAGLSAVPQLEVLAVAGRPQQDGAFFRIDRLKNLKELTIMPADRLTDALVGDIRFPPALETLFLLRADRLTDDAMRHIGSLTKLRRLDVDAAQVTDAGVLQLKDLKQLQLLHFYDAAVSGAGFRNAPWRSTLEQLRTGPGFKDAGIEALDGFARLKSLRMPSSKITDHGLKRLPKLESLDFLDLSRTAVSDAGLEFLAGRPRLERLLLVECKGVTDIGIATLSGWPNLKYVALKGTGVTTAGAKKLKTAIPNIEIYPPDLLSR